MAEFQEVMQQWVRARKATASNIQEDVLSVFPLKRYDDKFIANIEKNVMSWAAEHPEPVYPTWEEWLHDNGIILDARQHDEIEHWILGIEAMKPIPADIAEKLGIEPKEGA